MRTVDGFVITVITNVEQKEKDHKCDKPDNFEK